PRRSRRSSGLSALPCQHLQARVNRLVGAHRCAGLQRSSVLKHQADGFLIGAMVRGGTRSPTVCTKHWPDAALVPPPRQATTYKRLQPRALALTSGARESSRLKPLLRRSRAMPALSLRGQFARDPSLLRTQRFGHAVAIAVEILTDAAELGAPAFPVEAEQPGLRFPGQGDAVQVQVLRARQRADRRVDGAGLALHAADHPLEHAQVVAETRPQEIATVALAEPVDVEQLRQLRAGLV